MSRKPIVIDQQEMSLRRELDYFIRRETFATSERGRFAWEKRKDQAQKNLDVYLESREKNG